MAKDTSTLTPLESMFGAQPSPYGAGASDIENYQNALQNALSALEQRYSQPNWFKIAAGFAKPQLGGFAASLGSAADAMGEYVEQQRANQFPIAQLRAQIASSQIAMGQRKKAADLFSNALGVSPDEGSQILSGQKPMPAGGHRMMTPEVVGQLAALDPRIGSSAQALLESAHKEQEIANTANANKIAQYKVDVENAKLGRQGVSVPPPKLTDIQSGYNEAVPPPDDQSNVKKLDTSFNANYSLIPNAPVVKTEKSDQSSVIPRVESGGKNNVVSPKGASAAWQVMPNTAKDPGYGVTPAKDNSPEELNRVGQDYWNAMYNKFGTVSLADIAYNMGPDKTQKWIDGGSQWAKLPKETQNYISQTNLLRDMPSSKSAAESASAKQTSQPIILGSRQASFNPLYTQDDATNSLKLSDERREEIALKRLDKLEQAGNDATFAEAQDATDALRSTINSNKALAHSVVKPLQTKYYGLVNGLLGAAQAGLGFNINGFSGGLRVPVTEGIINSYSPPQYEMYQKLNSDSARVAAVQQSLRNVNPNAISNSEISMFKNMAPNPELQSIHLMTYMNEYTAINNRMVNEMRNAANKILRGEDSKYKIDPNSRTPTWDVLSSPAMAEIASKYRKEFQELNNDFSKFALKSKR